MEHVDEMHAAVLAWGRTHGRRLALRASRDAYRVLVAETMAQQTQISRVESALDGFLAAFPTLAALAAAPTADVLRAWRGLGYNRRALALQRTARIIVERHGGAVPADLGALVQLPGVGPYTARAITVHAFAARSCPVDTNVRRVLGRLIGADLAPRKLQHLADALAPAASAAWANALMDLGAGPCRPRDPDCRACPLRPWCRTAGGVAVERPASPRRSSDERPAVPFARSSRWLRGRILDRLRDAGGQGWAAFDGPMGTHAREDVRAMLDVLAAEGLLERHASAPDLARLPE